MNAQIHPVDREISKNKDGLMDWYRRRNQVISDYEKYRKPEEKFEAMATEIAVLRRSVGK